MRRFYFILLAITFHLSVQAQLITVEDKIFNWGGTVGLNAALPVVQSLTIENVAMEDIRLQYQVGFQTAVFARININRFYIQPSLTWQYSRGDIRFNIPTEEDNSITNETTEQLLTTQNKIAYKEATVEIPVMIGYYIVKEGPYALSTMFGPTFKYNYKSRYSTNLTDTAREFTDNNTPFGVGISAGIGVSIGRLFLDFNYEFGLNEVVSDFEAINNNSSSALTESESSMVIEKRTNMMSFSLGFLF